MPTFQLALALSFLVAPLALGAAPENALPGFPKLSAEMDWPWWRGPSRDGHAPADAPAPPLKWGEAENVLWKAPVPGRGHASPVVVGGRVFLATADDAAQTQSVIAFDRRDGKMAWRTDVNRGGLRPKLNAKNTHATGTVACDGDRVFVLFFLKNSAQLSALGVADGKQLWQVDLGAVEDKQYGHGLASSPVLYAGTVIVAAESDAGNSFLVAVDRATGKEVWRTPRPANTSYSTPSIGRVAGRDQLLISGADQVSGYDPATGKQLWSAPGTTKVTVGTLVWDGDVVIASGGFPQPGTLAVRPAADGSAKVLWKNSQKSYEPSLLAHAGHVYALTDNAMAFCWRIEDGKEMWKRRLEGTVSASGVVAGGHVYWPNGRGTTYVFKPTPEKFELVAENVLGEESLASPAVAGGQIFLRVASRDAGARHETLYCIGATK
jgi:outer membrane protein assembly factor BamB